MAGKVINLLDYIVPDKLGCDISAFWHTWDIGRRVKMDQWTEIRKYVFATDTTTTTNSKLPWKNKTTLPKLCQVRDNLHANYMAALFPRRKWLSWVAADSDSNTQIKREAVTNYANSIITNSEYEKTVSKLVYDYIDYGNAFVTTEWLDQRAEVDAQAKVQAGYVGPMIRRISPVDIVFNPIADNFTNTPKIVRSLVSIGEVKEMLTRMSKDEDNAAYLELWKYLKQYRDGLTNTYSNTTGGGEFQVKDEYLRVDGFTNWRYYLDSGYAELLTFYGDIYDTTSDTFYRNYKIIVVDRHKIICKMPNPSYFGTAPIHHVGWRTRQDNLWAMGPLDNLVGMQYRLDHIENLKADVFDLITAPPLKVKGYVDDFTWGPFEKIHVSEEGDVEMMAPPFQVLQANMELQAIEQRMEEMAGAPKEAMGIRSPGEKTAFEVQRLENAGGRIFQSKINQFERAIVEPSINDGVELGRRNLDTTQVTVFDDEFNFQTFQTITPDDIKANGKIVPVAARNFAEKAIMVQNLVQLASSPLYQDQAVNVHISGLKTAQLLEELLDIQDRELITPYVRISEQKQAEALAQVSRQQLGMEAQTPAGLTAGDHDADLGAGGQLGMGGGPPPGMPGKAMPGPGNPMLSPVAPPPGPK